MSSAPFVVALATLSPALAQVSIGGDSTPLDPASIDGSVDLTIGVTGAGSLTILNGSTLTNANGYVGFGGGGVGVVTVSGQGSRWDNLGDVVIGQSGNGALDIEAGGFVGGETGHIGASLGGVGVVTVSGADGSGNASTWSLRQDLNIGYPGTGTLNVEAGGHVAVGGRIDVGVAGQGKMELSDGATLSSNDGVVGTDAYGEAILTSGASWTMVGQLTVGLVAQGDLRIEDGASVTSNQGYVGAHPGSDGSVTVTGPGSSWEMTNFNLTLGNYGVGAMTIEDGARVYANTGVYLGISDATASGTLSVLGTPGSRGVLETSGFRGGLGTADVTLDGGIVRAIRNNTNFFSTYGAQQVTLGAGGGFIDTNGYNIGIAPVMIGAGSLTKDGLGTLTLTGANSYSGGTTITAGTLQLGNGGTTGSIVGNVANSGVLAFNRSDVVTFGGTIAGTGGVWQVGSGQTMLTADSSGLSGVSRVYNGILSVNGTLGGSIEVIGGRLQGIGQVGTTTNFAGGTIAPGNSIGTLTVAGNYLGNGGTLEIETVLSDDSSATDLLAVTGDTAGSTNVRVINVGGNGAQTSEGIKIVDVGGASDGDFTLLGSYTFEGAPAVVGGAYAYRLYQGSVSTPTDGDWYLRSALINGTTPTGPLYQAGAPVYEAYAAMLQSFNELETFQQRVGNRSWTAGMIETGALPEAAGAKSGIWGRIVGRHADMNSRFSTTAADFDVDTWQVQAGADQQLYSGEAGKLVGGLSARYGTIAGDVTSVFGNGSVSSTGYGLGGSLTWYGSSGFYLDAQANLTWYDSALASSTAATSLVSGNGGFGYAIGVEAGQQVALNQNWSITPQAQLTYSDVSYDGFTDAFGAAVSPAEGDDLTIRLGLSADYQDAWIDETGDTSRLHAYGIANLYYDVLPDSRTDLAGVELVNTQDNLWGGLGIGGTYSWGDDKYAIHGQAGVNTSLVNFGSSYSLAGTAGLTVKF
ncbi:autotransporter outer membrane beta-barrel domain-containing protein [Devosia neptuniae]|uniref:Autotransporter outer membrane beta-barrel domain-containing protein n=1 Tax=Devosia neptuniae TaxID=191302 RepID=A0ABY6CCV7_9HYPH|nr:autotransporter outer membrane beta-barrel domain-containing protein [Devosia neptuniae]UXN68967.1 autotransporter outer membrane beta-barrel domain-containing protein [Devosia neptuniae]